MLESGSSGSVRGVLSNEHPYREPGPGAEFALLAKSYRLAVPTVGAACLSPISATTTPTT